MFKFGYEIKKEKESLFTATWHAQAILKSMQICYSWAGILSHKLQD